MMATANSTTVTVGNSDDHLVVYGTATIRWHSNAFNDLPPLGEKEISVLVQIINIRITCLEEYVCH